MTRHLHHAIGGALLAALSLVPAHAQSGAEVAADIEVYAPGSGPVPHTIDASRVTFPGGIAARSDIIYATPIGYRPLTLDVYAPQQVAGPKRPLLIYVHGGSWLAGHPREAAAYKDWPALLARMAARGYVVASVSYRLSREAPFPTQIQDVKKAIQFLRANADTYGIDPERVGIWGDSAGGHLVGLAGVTCGVAAFAPVVEAPRRGPPPPPAPPPPSDCVQAVVGWYGIYDFLDEGPIKRPPPPPEDPVRLFLGCKTEQCTDAQKRAVSPVTYVDKGDAPMLLIHGSEDFAVPARQSEIMAEKLNAVGVPAQVHIIQGANHGWYAKTPEASRDASRKAMELTIDYFDAQLKPAR